MVSLIKTLPLGRLFCRVNFSLPFQMRAEHILKLYASYEYRYQQGHYDFRRVFENSIFIKVCYV